MARLGVQPAAILALGAAESDVALRMRALALLIQTSIEPAGGAWGARAAFDPSPYVRRAAVDAWAARLPESASVDALAGLAGRADVDSFTRARAATALARIGDTRTRPTMEACARDAAEDWQAAPCALAASWMGSQVGRERLAAALVEGELPLELGFPAAMADSGQVWLAPHLRAGVEVADPSLQLPLAAALMALDSPHGETVFRGALGSSEEERQLEAIDFLLDLNAPGVQALLRKGVHEGDGLVRAYAQMALDVRSGAVPTVAIGHLGSPDREARRMAVRCLGRALGGRPVEPTEARPWRAAAQALIGALEDQEDAVRVEAVRALAPLGLAEAAAPLAQMALDGELHIRVEAAGALLAIPLQPTG